MATRIESAPNLSGRIPAADNNNSGFMLSQGAPALSLVRTEPFVVAQPPVQYTRDAATLMLYRAMDLALASLCLMLLWPLMLTAAILVVMGSRGPIFYSQVRFGRDGAIFGCLKFRTMQPDAERLLAHGRSAGGAARRPAAGRVRHRVGAHGAHIVAHDFGGAVSLRAQRCSTRVASNRAGTSRGISSSPTVCRES